jgi:hypothetical protein
MNNLVYHFDVCGRFIVHFLDKKFQNTIKI